MLGLSVKSFYETYKKNLQLEFINPAVNNTKILTTPDLNRPALALTGYLKHFAHNRLQILGNVEINFLKDLYKTKDIKFKISTILEKFDIPCFVITNSLKPPPEFVEEFKKHQIPLLTTKMTTADFIKESSAYLRDELAPRISIHGTLLEISGLGVIIIGKSGIGKSECAIDLIKKGHQLVSDDLINIKKLVGGVLVGFVGNVLKHYMEIRGMGIINIKQLFGVSSVLDKTNIDLVIELQEWTTQKEYDRLGQTNLYENILDTEIPKLIVPVKPGRTLTVLIELAVMNFRLKKQGYNTIEELNSNLIKHMKNKRTKNDKKR